MPSLYVDTTELQAVMKEMSKALSHEGFVKLMRWTFTDVGRKARTLIYKAVKEEYTAPAAWIKSAIQNPRVTIGSSVTCIIPLAGPRGGIGDIYKAAGGLHGWASLHRKYKVKAHILAGGTSTMPEPMDSGLKAFRNLSCGKVAFFRSGRKRLPIKKITGIAMPQMPLNRASDETVTELFNYTSERLYHNFGRLFKG